LRCARCINTETQAGKQGVPKADFGLYPYDILDTVTDRGRINRIVDAEVDIGKEKVARGFNFELTIAPLLSANAWEPSECTLFFAQPQSNTVKTMAVIVL